MPLILAISTALTIFVLMRYFLSLNRRFIKKQDKSFSERAPGIGETGMVILAHIWFNDGTKERVDISFYGDSYDFKKQYQFIKYADKYFELQMYSANSLGAYDMEAYYGEIKTAHLPGYANPQYIYRPLIYQKKCECGSDAVKSTRHSSWCPKYVQSEDA